MMQPNYIVWNCSQYHHCSSSFESVWQIALATWDVVSANHQQNNQQDFTNATDEFAEHYIGQTAIADQPVYLMKATKPNRMKVKTLSARLRFINSLMGWFLGANHLAPYDDEQLKQLFYNLMPLKWFHQFAQSGQELMTLQQQLQQLSRTTTTATTMTIFFNRLTKQN